MANQAANNEVSEILEAKLSELRQNYTDELESILREVQADIESTRKETEADRIVELEKQLHS